MARSYYLFILTLVGLLVGVACLFFRSEHKTKGGLFLSASRMTHSHILEFLANLEKQHDVTIVYAAEAGSRALGLNSESSDYDLRFVFKHNERNKYLSLYQPAEVISGFHSSDENVYDYQGWDIKKALCLLQSHNVALLEWIYSPGVYINEYDFCARAAHMVDSEQRRIPIVFHYASMCKKHCEALVSCDNDGQADEGQVKVKKYLHTVRAACMVEWQFREAGCKAPTYQTLRLPLEDVLSDLEGFISLEVMDEIHGLVEMKKASVEICHRVPILDEFILAHHTSAAFTSRVMEVLGPENDRYNSGKKKQANANVPENAVSAGGMKEKCDELLFHVLGR